MAAALDKGGHYRPGNKELVGLVDGVWEVVSSYMPAYLLPGPWVVADSVLWFLTTPAGL